MSRRRGLFHHNMTMGAVMMMVRPVIKIVVGLGSTEEILLFLNTAPGVAPDPAAQPGCRCSSLQPRNRRTAAL